MAPGGARRLFLQGSQEDRRERGEDLFPERGKRSQLQHRGERKNVSVSGHLVENAEWERPSKKYIK